MKHSNGKSVIASMYNAQQVRVFIPEKLSIDGHMYVVPFVINKMSVIAEQQYKVWGSAWGVIRILFEHVSMSMTSAFTMSMIRTYYNRSITSKQPGNAKLLVSVDMQDPSALSVPGQIMFDKYKTGDEKLDKDLVVKMGSAKMVSADDYDKIKRGS